MPMQMQDIEAFIQLLRSVSRQSVAAKAVGKRNGRRSVYEWQSCWMAVYRDGNRR